MRHDIKSNPAKLIEVEKFYAKKLQQHLEGKEFIGRSRNCEFVFVNKPGAFGLSIKYEIVGTELIYSPLINNTLSAQDAIRARQDAEDWATQKYFRELLKVMPLVKQMSMQSGVHWKETMASKHEETALASLRGIKGYEDISANGELTKCTIDTQGEKGVEKCMITGKIQPNSEVIQTKKPLTVIQKMELEAKRTLNR